MVNFIRLNATLIGFLILVIFMTSCYRKSKEIGDVVKVHVTNFPESFHPYFHKSNVGIHVVKHIYQPLIDIDYQSGELIPVLAVSRPEIIENENGETYYHFKIKKNAVWDDGSPVTAEDVLFSWKIVKLPSTHKNILRDQYFEMFDGFELDPKDKKAFSLKCSQKYVQGEMAFADLLIIPKQVFDPKDFVNNISIQQCVKQDFTGDELKALDTYMKDFESLIYDDNKRVNTGSGPYKLIIEKENKSFRLAKKKLWWGDEEEQNMFFQNKADNIQYFVEKKIDRAIAKLMLEELDITTNVPVKDLQNLNRSKIFNQEFQIFTPTKFSFTYLGINFKHPFLKEHKLRKALALAIDKEKIIEQILGGYAESITSSFHPSSPSYNRNIKDYPFDLSKAEALLAEDGWVDVDKDGYKEKLIGNKMVPLQLKLNFPKNYTAAKIGEFLQESFKSIGLKLDLHELSFDSYLKLNHAHDFDMILGSFQTFPNTIDPKQLWHSNSYGKGINWVAYQSDEVDELIDLIRSEDVVQKRIDHEKEMQEIIHADIPFVFLFAPQHKIIVSKHIQTPLISSIGLGYWESNFVRE